MNNIKNKFRAGLAVAAGLVAMYSCTDTWNDHYSADSSTGYAGTTMQAIEEQASDFAKVIKAYGYDRELNSASVFTVWAPANGTFDVSEYVDAQGNMIADSAAVVKQFIKNHIARYAISENGQEKVVDLMNKKRIKMSADGMFGLANITKPNIACQNGLLHIVDAASKYSFNLFEMIEHQYQADDYPTKDSISLYAFLYDVENNKDTLIEDKSVSRGVDENGDKIWVDSFVMTNNTALKNVDAKLYEEDSSFIAIIPSAKAWTERYNKAVSLLKFNPNEDAKSPGACDSLLHHYANRFAMADLFYNKNANEHFQDSLKSTLYRLDMRNFDWSKNVYYSKMPKAMPEDKEINDILSKCGTPVECSNGQAYLVDEYPFSAVEQFFSRISVPANNTSVDQSLNSKGAEAFTKNVNMSFRRHNGTLYLTLRNEETGETKRLTENYGYVDFVPKSGSVNPYIAFQIPNTLSGTYDMYVVTCPIFLKDNLDGVSIADLDKRPYRFYTYVIERDAKGVYPESGKRIANPDGSGNYFISGGLKMSEQGGIAVNDTTYLGQYTFENAYYGRNEEGVLIQLQSQVTSKLTSEYSREMLVNCIILKPHDEDSTEEPVAVKPRAYAAGTKNSNKVTITNIRN